MEITVRYKGRGTGILRTERMRVANLNTAIGLLERRLRNSRTFQKANVFEDGIPRLEVSASGGGVTTTAYGYAGEAAHV
ncbi:hypothetical protein [Brevundimonas faecalis]|uniref:Uncharacterized protein n=1 Tax=Brevundimonas faecalis TaxID=947378 RepID=A0ABV2R8Q0_9CAUL